MIFTNPTEIFQNALDKKQAIGAFNVYNMETIQAVVEAVKITKTPAFIQVSKGAIAYAGLDFIVAIAKTAIKNCPIPIALHLDHGADFEICKKCIDAGFSSVMIDGSALSYKENVKLTKKVVDYAHKNGVVVEAELGQLKGVEDDVSAEKSTYTDPKQAVEFIEKTGCDSLAISIGTSHGAYKFTGEPSLDFDRLVEIKKSIEEMTKKPYPLVLHGASSVKPELVKIANSFGAKLGNAQGVPEKLLQKASKLGIAKINVDTDLRLAMTTIIRKKLLENPENIDPRKYLTPARNEITKIITDKIEIFKGGKNEKN
ncbi:MAG: class II fructose-bisphosphate aldolase [Alphaproteobacteria bacterium]